MQMDFSGENLTRHYQDMEERSGLRSRYCSRDHTYYRKTGIKIKSTNKNKTKKNDGTVFLSALIR